MRPSPDLSAATVAAFRRRTRRGGLLLLGAVILLSALAIGLAEPFTGLAALGLTFGGGLWFALRSLRSRWAAFRGLPIADDRGF